MKEIKFEIIKRKNIAIDIPLEMQRNYPIHQQFLFEEEKCIVIYQFEPTKNLNEIDYLNYLKRYIVEKLNAISITTYIK